MVVFQEWGLAAPPLQVPLAVWFPRYLSHLASRPLSSGPAERNRAGTGLESRPGRRGQQTEARRAQSARFRQLKGYAAAAARAEGRGGCWQVAPAHWERSLCPAAAEPPACPPAARSARQSARVRWWVRSPGPFPRPPLPPCPPRPYPAPSASAPHPGSVTLPPPYNSGRECPARDNLAAPRWLWSRSSGRPPPAPPQAPAPRWVPPGGSSSLLSLRLRFASAGPAERHCARAAPLPRPWHPGCREPPTPSSYPRAAAMARCWVSGPHHPEYPAPHGAGSEISRSMLPIAWALPFGYESFLLFTLPLLSPSVALLQGGERWAPTLPRTHTHIHYLHHFRDQIIHCASFFRLTVCPFSPVSGVSLVLRAVQASLGCSMVVTPWFLPSLQRWQWSPLPLGLFTFLSQVPKHPVQPDDQGQFLSISQTLTPYAHCSWWLLLLGCAWMVHDFRCLCR